MTKEIWILAGCSLLAGVFFWFSMPFMATASWVAAGLYSMRHIFTESD